MLPSLYLYEGLKRDMTFYIYLGIKVINLTSGIDHKPIA